MRFMQEMMELSSQQQKEQLPPRAVQIVSHPFFGRVVLTAGPAQFGLDLYKSSSGVSMINCDFLLCTFSLFFFFAYLCAVLGLFLLKGILFFFLYPCYIVYSVLFYPLSQVRGFVTVAEPYNGCTELSNSEIVAGRIALLQRGQCMFAEKARHIQKAGAIGGIVIGEKRFRESISIYFRSFKYFLMPRTPQM